MRKVQVGSRGELSLEWWWTDGEGRHFQAEVRTGAGGGGLVFLEVEKSRPINPAKKSREKWVIRAGGAGFKESWVDIGQTNPGLNVRTECGLRIHLHIQHSFVHSGNMY